MGQTIKKIISSLADDSHFGYRALKKFPHIFGRGTPAKFLIKFLRNDPSVSTVTELQYMTQLYGGQGWTPELKGKYSPATHVRKTERPFLKWHTTYCSYTDRDVKVVSSMQYAKNVFLQYVTVTRMMY